MKEEINNTELANDKLWHLIEEPARHRRIKNLNLYTMELIRPLSIFNVVLEKAKLRLEGKSYNKRRPSVGTAFSVGEHKLKLYPQLYSTATGWQLNGEIDITIEGLTTKYALKYKDGIISGRQNYIFHNSMAFFISYKQTISALYILLTDTKKVLASSKWCIYCTRLLTDPVSIDLGIGSQCRRDHAEPIRRLQEMLDGIINGISAAEDTTFLSKSE